jgi:hypothetical protein
MFAGIGVNWGKDMAMEIVSLAGNQRGERRADLVFETRK